jgi:hypothetical protein
MEKFKKAINSEKKGLLEEAKRKVEVEIEQ